MIHCQILVALQVALPAKKSFLRSFELNKAALSMLPPLPVPQDFCHQLEPGAPLSKHVDSLGEYFSGAEIVLEAVERDDYLENYDEGDDHHLRITRPNSTVFLRIKARGDFDQDGLDDIVLSMRSDYDEHLFTEGRNYFLTRDGPGKALRRLDIYPYPWAPECVNIMNDD